jgi:L-fucose mutarotase
MLRDSVRVLKTRLLQPQLLQALAAGGHSSRILIADGNYPFSTRLGPSAILVSLNLSPGIVSCTDVLEAVLSAVPIEMATVMQPAPSGPYSLDAEPPIWAEFQRLLDQAGGGVNLDRLERFAFFEAASTPDVAVTVATGDQRLYANLLLQIGVVFPE